MPGPACWRLLAGRRCPAGDLRAAWLHSLLRVALTIGAYCGKCAAPARALLAGRSALRAVLYGEG